MSASTDSPAASEIDTGALPRLIVDPEILTRNLAAPTAVAPGVNVRPHAKTHKSAEIARRQLAAGAVGLTVATVGEAEVFADHGVTDLFIAFPVWTDDAVAARLRALAARTALRVGVDSIGGAQRLAAAGAGVEVLVEIDSGHHRTGVPAAQAGEVARAAADGGLDVVGAFTFPGHGYGPDARAAAAADEAAALAAAADAMRAAGVEPRVLSGGSTPTLAGTDTGVITETRPGVYVFNDAQQVELGSATFADVALWAEAYVVHVSADRYVLGVGSKTLGADRAAWATGFGRLPDHPDARITALSEHHATVPAETVGEHGLRLGDVVRVVPNHVCTAVNLADRLHLRGSDESWPVDARGANG